MRYYTLLSVSWELIIFTLDTNLLFIPRKNWGKSLVSNRWHTDAASVRPEKMKEEVKTVRDDYVMKKQWPILYTTWRFWQPQTNCNEGLFWKNLKCSSEGSSKLSPASYSGAFQQIRNREPLEWFCYFAPTLNVPMVHCAILVVCSQSSFLRNT